MILPLFSLFLLLNAINAHRSIIANYERRLNEALNRQMSSNNSSSQRVIKRYKCVEVYVTVDADGNEIDSVEVASPSLSATTTTTTALPKIIRKSPKKKIRIEWKKAREASDEDNNSDRIIEKMYLQKNEDVASQGDDKQNYSIYYKNYAKMHKTRPFGLRRRRLHNYRKLESLRTSNEYLFSPMSPITTRPLEPPINYQQLQLANAFIPPLTTTPIPEWQEATEESCSKIKSLSQQFGIDNVSDWARNNCSFLQLYAPTATCELIFHFIDSCKRIRSFTAI